MNSSKSKVSQSNSICPMRRRDKDEVYCDFILIHPLKQTNIMKKILILGGLFLFSCVFVTRALAYQDYDIGTHYSMQHIDVAVLPVAEITDSEAYCSITSVYNWGYVSNVLGAELLVESRCNGPPGN